MAAFQSPSQQIQYPNPIQIVQPPIRGNACERHIILDDHDPCKKKHVHMALVEIQKGQVITMCPWCVEKVYGDGKFKEWGELIEGRNANSTVSANVNEQQKENALALFNKRIVATAVQSIDKSATTHRLGEAEATGALHLQTTGVVRGLPIVRDFCPSLQHEKENAKPPLSIPFQSMSPLGENRTTDTGLVSLAGALHTVLEGIHAPDEDQESSTLVKGKRKQHSTIKLQKKKTSRIIKGTEKVQNKDTCTRTVKSAKHDTTTSTPADAQPAKMPKVSASGSESNHVPEGILNSLWKLSPFPIDPTILESPLFVILNKHGVLQGDNVSKEGT